jgi:uncharacterized protein YydD (DUF2326 family)
MKACQEKTEATIHSIWSELEETIKHQMEDIQACVDQMMQGFRKELTENIDEMQVDLQAVKMSLYTWTKNLQESIVDMRNNLHEELGLMLQVKAQTMKALVVDCKV